MRLALLQIDLPATSGSRAEAAPQAAGNLLAPEVDTSFGSLLEKADATTNVSRKPVSEAKPRPKVHPDESFPQQPLVSVPPPLTAAQNISPSAQPLDAAWPSSTRNENAPQSSFPPVDLLIPQSAFTDAPSARISHSPGETSAPQVAASGSDEETSASSGSSLAPPNAGEQAPILERSAYPDHVANEATFTQLSNLREPVFTPQVEGTRLPREHVPKARAEADSREHGNAQKTPVSSTPATSSPLAPSLLDSSPLQREVQALETTPQEVRPTRAPTSESASIQPAIPPPNANLSSRAKAPDGNVRDAREAPSGTSSSSTSGSTTTSPSSSAAPSSIAPKASTVGTEERGTPPLTNASQSLVEVNPLGPRSSLPNADLQEAQIPTSAHGSAQEAALPTLGQARLVQSLSGAQMEVSVRSGDFGRVTVRADYARTLLNTQITLESPQLATALAPHVSAVEQRLAQEHGLKTTLSVVNAEVNRDASSQRNAGTSSGSGQHTKQESAARGTTSGLSMRQLQPPPIPSAPPSTDSSTQRLNIRI